MAFDISTARPVDDPEQVSLPEQPDVSRGTENGAFTEAGQAILDIPGGAAVSEFVSAVNRGAINLLDFIGPDQINNALQLAGSETRVPTLKEQPIIQEATTGEFLEPGLARQAIRTAGEFVAPGGVVGQVARTVARAAPKVLPGAQTTGQRIVQQLGGSTAAQDVAGAALSGAGAEIGEEAGGEPGALIGSVFAPVAGLSIKPVLGRMLAAGKRGIESMMKPLSAMSEEGASTLLAEAMVREGLGPDEVVARLQQLGPEALPADIGNNFARLLRAASNKIPRIEGEAGKVLAARQAGQGGRILAGFDEAAGTRVSVDDEIARLNAVLEPEISRLYKEAGAEAIQLSPRLRKLLEGKSSLGRAQRKAQIRLADKRAAGDEITNIDIINATKQELDDQIGRAIRQGENNKVRDLVRLKNVMVAEADRAIPVYKQARDMFAGKVALENAAISGEMFLKMKARDMRELTRTFSESEKKLFKMGAKRAILDKIDDLQTNADAVKRLFGKNGDVKKLRFLFDDNTSFNRFSETLKRESDFIMTRRAAQANSTTAKQLADEESAFAVLNNTAQIIASPLGRFNVTRRIVSDLRGKKTDETYIAALEQAGDILLVKGIDPGRIRNILTKGSAKMIEKRLEAALEKPTIQPYLPSAITGAVLTEEQR